MLEAFTWIECSTFQHLKSDWGRCNDSFQIQYMCHWPQMNATTIALSYVQMPLYTQKQHSGLKFCIAAEMRWSADSNLSVPLMHHITYDLLKKNGKHIKRNEKR